MALCLCPSWNGTSPCRPGGPCRWRLCSGCRSMPTPSASPRSGGAGRQGGATGNSISLYDGDRDGVDPGIYDPQKSDALATVSVVLRGSQSSGSCSLGICLTHSSKAWQKSMEYWERAEKTPKGKQRLTRRTLFMLGCLAQAAA